MRYEVSRRELSKPDMLSQQVGGRRPDASVYYVAHVATRSMRPTSRRLLETALREYQHGEVQDEVLGEVN